MLTIPGIPPWLAWLPRQTLSSWEIKRQLISNKRQYNKKEEQINCLPFSPTSIYFHIIYFLFSWKRWDEDVSIVFSHHVRLVQLGISNRFVSKLLCLRWAAGQEKSGFY